MVREEGREEIERETEVEKVKTAPLPTSSSSFNNVVENIDKINLECIVWNLESSLTPDVSSWMEI